MAKLHKVQLGYYPPRQGRENQYRLLYDGKKRSVTNHVNESGALALS